MYNYAYQNKGLNYYVVGSDFHGTFSIVPNELVETNLINSTSLWFSSFSSVSLRMNEIEDDIEYYPLTQCFVVLLINYHWTKQCCLHPTLQLTTIQPRKRCIYSHIQQYVKPVHLT